MIIKIALLLLYFVIGLWLFVSAINLLGGREAAGYDSPIIFVIGLLTVILFWPYFMLKSIFRRRK